MYVFVIVDKLNHCTAFKPKVSPWDNKYTHADIQVGLSVSHRDSLCVPVEEVLRFQGLKIRKLSGTNEDTQGPSGSEAPPFWRFRDTKKKLSYCENTLTIASQTSNHTIQELNQDLKVPSMRFCHITQK